MPKVLNGRPGKIQRNAHDGDEGYDAQHPNRDLVVFQYDDGGEEVVLRTEIKDQAEPPLDEDGEATGGKPGQGATTGRTPPA